ncbi:DUF6090 family protein [Roseivirga misakiensis]|uniref:Uncharacterized protein n=1 Tax=Roseivirga misakiensis TaxID=1563681 RepID=A0A1E5SLB6_9BACT|nr:DUF6090 family protein [Roseivirga misakiensis]OEJ99836.1 hypothetical protein BFP71_09810 [Roseivirga misakiensis]
MIKFFRSIRGKLISQSKTGTYLKYAIGEITLVMIGILLAMGINNWNQDRLKRKQELVYLTNLKNDLSNNIELLTPLDSIYKINISNLQKGIQLFKNTPSIFDFRTIDSLTSTYWSIFPVNRSTYDEMLSGGNFYSIRNATLKEKISNHYNLAESYESAFQEINRNGQDITNLNKELYPLLVLIDRLKQSPIDLKGIDTTWIHNPNSASYIGFFKQASFFTETDKYRLNEIKDFINNCKKLMVDIDQELETRNY